MEKEKRYTVSLDAYLWAKNDKESKVNNFKVGDNPTYESIPIKTKDFIEQGNIIIYDDIMANWL